MRKLTLKLLIIVVILFQTLNTQAQFANSVEINRPFENITNPVICDMDNDGDKDVVIYGENVYWLENDGSNNFWGEFNNITKAESNIPSSIHTTDLNNDGYIDVLLGTRRGWLWYRNDSLKDFTFMEKIITHDNAYYKISNIITEDFDADGDKDIIFAVDNWFIGMQKNLGNEKFDTNIIEITCDFNTHVLKSIDIDNDGDIDFMTSCESNGEIAWYENDGDGNFSNKNLIGNSEQVLRAYPIDFDGDSLIDIVTCSIAEDDIFWFKQDSVGYFSDKKYIYKTTVSYYNPYLAIPYDTDNDSDYDIVCFRGNKIDLHENNGDGSFKSAVTITEESRYGIFLLVDDLDKDDLYDLITVESGGFICEKRLFDNLGDNNFRIETITSRLNMIQVINHGDFDGDGDEDIVSVSKTDDKVSWFENNGKGEFKGENLIFSHPYYFDAPEGVVTLDYDDDDDIDILASSNVDGIALFENLGNGKFDTYKEFDVTLGNSMFVEDFNNDNKLDLLHSTYNKIMWSQNMGNGNFSSSNIIDQYDMYINDITVVDIDNDGDNDVISAIRNPEKVVWYKNDGTGNFSNQITVDTNLLNPISIYTADLDGDTDLDILSADTESDSVVWYENDGIGNFISKHVICFKHKKPNRVITMDIDNDNDEDVIIGLRENDTIFTFYNDGNGIFENYTYVLNESNYINCMLSLDADNDGDSDLLTANIANYSIDYYENISVCSNTFNSIIESSCNRYVSPSGKIWLTSGVYLDTIPNVFGCDSIINISLTINPAFNLSESFTICSGSDYTFSDGTIQSNITSKIVHVSHLQSVFGCDSTIETTIEVDPLPVSEYSYAKENDKVTFTNGSSYAETYNWNFDDGENSIEENPVHVYSQSGDYDVILDATNNCGTMSSQENIEIVITGLNDLEDFIISVYPNPVEEKLIVEYNKEIIIEIYNLAGIKILESNKTEIDVSGLVNGTYIVLIKNSENELMRKIKIVKE